MLYYSDITKLVSERRDLAYLLICYKTLTISYKPAILFRRCLLTSFLFIIIHFMNDVNTQAPVEETPVAPTETPAEETPATEPAA